MTKQADIKKVQSGNDAKRKGDKDDDPDDKEYHSCGEGEPDKDANIKGESKLGAKVTNKEGGEKVVIGSHG